MFKNLLVIVSLFASSFTFNYKLSGNNGEILYGPNFHLFKRSENGDVKTAEWLIGQYMQGNQIDIKILDSMLQEKNAFAQYLKGRWHLYTKKYDSAVEWLTKSSKNNHAPATGLLGAMFYYGVGVEKNAQKGFDFFVQSAKKGNSDSQLELYKIWGLGGYSYIGNEEAIRWLLKAAQNENLDALSLLCNRLHDWADEPNLHEITEVKKVLARESNISVVELTSKNGIFREWRKWIRKRIELGDADAMASLAFAYKFGQGIPSSQKEAFNWLIKAAEAGHANSQKDVAILYSLGTGGIVKNEKKAFEWNKKAAEQGVYSSQRSLAFAFEKGDIVIKDLIASYAWYHVSEVCKNEIDEMMELSTKEIAPNYNPINDKLDLNLTDAQITKAESLANEIFKRIESNRINKRN